MKILITGANGFVGKNIVETLKNIMEKKDQSRNIMIEEIFCFDISNKLDDLDVYTKQCDYVINLAGINRPKDSEEFYAGNLGFVETLCCSLNKNSNKCPIIASSSIQVGKDNDYAKSKQDGEEFLKSFSKKFGNPVYIYRFSNLFGKWCKPNYNSVVATWCYNIANGLEIQVHDPKTELSLCYIDDVINEIISCMLGNPRFNGEFCEVMPCFKISLGKLFDILKSFQSSRENLYLVNQSDEFSKKLYATFLSHLSTDSFSYPLNMHIDERGSFTEFIKTIEYGQVSVNISKPYVTKGNHWHHTKNEKFLVVSGKGIVRFRKIQTDEIIQYRVSSEKLEVIDIPPGYTHSIENLGTDNMVTIMWANEAFDPYKPDTFFEEV